MLGKPSLFEERMTAMIKQHIEDEIERELTAAAQEIERRVRQRVAAITVNVFGAVDMFRDEGRLVVTVKMPPEVGA